jgi:hypothetical protein
MPVADALLTSVSKANRSNANPAEAAADQTKNSDFLTVQSFTNFAAVTGAVTTAWKALESLNSSLFGPNYTPFCLALLWLVVSVSLAVQADRSHVRTWAFWSSSLFIGTLNALVIFAAVIGLS